MLDSEDDGAADARRQWKRDQLRIWKERHPDKVKEYRDRYRARHLDEIRVQNRERERGRRAQQREEAHQRETKRSTAREWYANNRDRHLAYQRAYRAAQRAADPEKYREDKRARNKRWRDSHREQENAKLRAKHRENPALKRERAAQYYATHGDDVRARRRAYYVAHREQQLATQRAWREREKRRRGAGLPPIRLHHVPRDERQANTNAAEQFFGHPYTSTEVAAIRDTLATPPELYAAWERECLRARAAHQLATDRDMRERLCSELAANSTTPTPQEVENARLDAIGREVNERLRRKEPPRRTHHLDPAAPHPMLQHDGGMGLSR